VTGVVVMVRAVLSGQGQLLSLREAGSGWPLVPIGVSGKQVAPRLVPAEPRETGGKDSLASCRCWDIKNESSS
jgi:hypothetical protein